MRTRHTIRTHVRRGFTLIEAVGAIVILAALGTAASNILLTASDGYIDAATSAQLHAEASIGLDRIVRELRSIDLDTDAVSVAPDIEDVTASSIQWHDDDDNDHEIALSGTDLTIQVDGGTDDVLMTDVTEFSVQCYDEDNTAMSQTLSGASCDDIRRIEVTLTVSRNGVSDTVRTRVFVRATMHGAES